MRCTFRCACPPRSSPGPEPLDVEPGDDGAPPPPNSDVGRLPPPSPAPPYSAGLTGGVGTFPLGPRPPPAPTPLDAPALSVGDFSMASSFRPAAAPGSAPCEYPSPIFAGRGVGVGRSEPPPAAAIELSDSPLVTRCVPPPGRFNVDRSAILLGSLRWGFAAYNDDHGASCAGLPRRERVASATVITRLKIAHILSTLSLASLVFAP